MSRRRPSSFPACVITIPAWPARTSEIVGHRAPAAVDGEAVSRSGISARCGPALVLLSGRRLRLGRWSTAVSAAEEAAGCAPSPTSPSGTLVTLAAHAAVAARRGDFATANDLIQVAEQVASAHHFAAANAVILFARATMASGQGQYERAFAHLARLHGPSDLSPPPRPRAMVTRQPRWSRGDVRRDRRRPPNSRRPATRRPRHPLTSRAGKPHLRQGRTRQRERNRDQAA